MYKLLSLRQGHTEALYFLCTLVLISAVSACTGVPKDVVPVKGFELERYLGKWYEIARLDHRFERGLVNVTAEYTLRDDGGIRVVNRGLRSDVNEWSEIEGKAYFVGPEDVGHLKVSFFGPFYASYVVFGLDEQDYQYAFVSGNSTSYLWLLSRTPAASDEVLALFKARALELTFNLESLIYVSHE
ncbi:MAG: lipocalin [Burkholderiales bacterium]|nr:lipocalin [Burkholderiales bacterium]